MFINILCHVARDQSSQGKALGIALDGIQAAGKMPEPAALP